MEKSGAQRLILPNLNPSTLQTLFPKPQGGAKPPPRPSIGAALSLGGAMGGSVPRQRRLITDQEMLAFPRGTASTSPPGAFKPRRVNFTPKEVDVLLQAVRTHRELVLYGVAGGRGWSNAWVNIAATVSQADKIHRSESDVRKKWTYLKWEAKNTSKPGRDATSRAVLNILKSQDEDGNVSARDLYEELTHMVPPQIGKVASPGVQPPPTAPRRIHMKVLAPKPSSPPPPPPPPEVCLRWNSYHSNMQATFPALLTSQRYVDVTLACEGRSIQCHKMMLSACSTYFDELLSQNPCQHPIVLMKDLKFWEIQALVDFMYRGEVNVSQDKLPSLLAAAEALQIKGLAGPASVPGPSSHDQPDEASAPLLEHFAEADLGGNVLAALGAAPQQGRRVRRRRVVAAASAPTPLVSHNSPAKASPSGNSNAIGGQRSLLAVGRKRRMEPLPQPMRIKLEPPDEPQEPDEPGTDNDQDADDDRFTIDTTAMHAEHEDNAGDTDPGPSCNNGSAAEPDSSYDDDPNPLLPEVVMASDQASN